MKGSSEWESVWADIESRTLKEDRQYAGVEIVRQRNLRDDNAAEFKRIFDMPIRAFYESGMMIILGINSINFLDAVSIKHLGIVHSENNYSGYDLIRKFYGEEGDELFRRLAI